MVKSKYVHWREPQVNHILKKIYGNKGESIAEVLIAALIISLGTILIITMINASFKLLTNEEKSYKEFIDAKNEFAATYYKETDATTKEITLQCAGYSNISKIINVYSKTFKGLTFYRLVAK